MNRMVLVNTVRKKASPLLLLISGILLFSATTLAGAEPTSDPAASDNATVKKSVSITLVIANQLVSGRAVLPASDTEFSLIGAGGEQQTYQWSQLDALELRRVQRLYGLNEERKSNPIGRPIEGLRLTMTNGQILEGLRIPARDQAGQIALQTRNIHFMLIAANEIQSREKIDGHEGDYFSAQEIYERMTADNSPDPKSAVDQLSWAKKAEELGLYETAIGHLKSAEAIAPRTKESSKELRESLVTQQSLKSAQTIYEHLLRSMKAGNSLEALADLDRLEHNFPNSELRSRWSTLKPQLEVARKTDLTKLVVQAYYSVAEDVLQNKLQQKVRLDAKGNIVPSLPGKQLTTKSGDIFRGILDSADNGKETEPNGEVQLICNGTRTKIPKSEIASMIDVDMSVGVRSADPTFDDLKNWVSDLSNIGGLKGQTTLRIAQTMNVKPAEVRGIINNRLNKDAAYKNGKLTTVASYVSSHTASYDKGSWLRDGMSFIPNEESTTPTRTQYRVVKGPDGKQHFVPDGTTEQKEKIVTENSDDANEWWKTQTMETRLSVLRAFMAERLFHVKSVENIACKGCGGQGTLTAVGASGAGNTSRCPSCRGLKVLYRITYE